MPETVLNQNRPVNTKLTHSPCCGQKSVNGSKTVDDWLTDQLGWLVDERLTGQLVVRFAIDSLTEIQVSKVRKKGLKHGTPCQYPRCDCDDYVRPQTMFKPRFSSLTCQKCRHKESEHRLKTKFDKVKKEQLDKAESFPCIGCSCQGYKRPDSSVSAETPQARQCTDCKHHIDAHRPMTETDQYIIASLSTASQLHCHSEAKKDGYKQNEDDEEEEEDEDEEVDMTPWFEAVAIDPDEVEEQSFLKTCRCRGFGVSSDDLMKTCHRYHGFTIDLVGPLLPTLQCPKCQHYLKDHREPTEQEELQRSIERAKVLSLVKAVGLRSSKQFVSHKAASLLLPNNVSQMIFARTQDSSSSSTKYQVTCSILSKPLSKLLFNAASTQNGSDIKSHNDTNIKSGVRKRRSYESVTSSLPSTPVKRRKSDQDVYETSDENKEVIAMETIRKKVKVPDKIISGILENLNNTDNLMNITTCIPITVMEWCPVTVDDALFLSIGHSKGQISIYKVHQNKCKALIIHGDPTSAPVTKLTWFSKKRKCYLLSAYKDGHICLWQLVNTTELVLVQDISNIPTKVTTMAVSADSVYMAIGYSNSTVMFYKINDQNTADKVQLSLINKTSTAYGSVLCLSWHPTKRMVAAGGEDDNVTIFYLRSSEMEGDRRSMGSITRYFSPKKHPMRPDIFHKCCLLKGHVSFVSALTFDPNGKYLLSAGWDGQILFWRVAEIDDIITNNDDVTIMECTSGYMVGQQRLTKSCDDVINRGALMATSLSVLDDILFVVAKVTAGQVYVSAYRIPDKYL
ncbi:uncharacterized protein LOC144442920 [Glandiceps talaboti]